jgi:hypothetical protein
LYRTLHPYSATHDGFDWPARPIDHPLAPNIGSFDVWSRLFLVNKPGTAGGKIRLTKQQWEVIQALNEFNPLFAKWAVGQNNISTRIMRWENGYPYPAFHYPLCFGGNLVNVLEFRGQFARIQTLPAGVDFPVNPPAYLKHRCWSVYKAKTNIIRDAPLGGVATPAYMLVLAHTDSAWIYNHGLLKYES